MIRQSVDWIRSGQSQNAKNCRRILKNILKMQMPVIPLVHYAMWSTHQIISTALQFIGRVVYYTPMFKARIGQSPENLYLYSGMPLLLGNLKIRLGANNRVSGISTICGRGASQHTPELITGDNVDIGWQNTLAIGSKIELGNNVRLAGRVFLAGYPGHPMNAKDRAAGLPELDNQVGDIILHDDVWVGTGATILAGVTIGKGAIVAAGAVVTKDVEAGNIVAGNPAKVVRKLPEADYV